MWRSGAPQRRVARAAPQGRRCTYVLLCVVAPSINMVDYQYSDLLDRGLLLDARNLLACADLG